MNERFKELRAEAQELACQEHHTGRALDFKGMEQQCPDFQIFIARLHTSYEKFAELIVRECAQTADKAEPYQASELILKHFGVEHS